MQKLIAKYGTAVHLALLVAAPLFLFPFFGEVEIATALLWLSVPAFSWMILEPSVRSGESLHGARRRVLRAIRSDPLFWVSLFLVLMAGVRALNGGIALVYDAETAKWTLSSSVFPILPGCVEKKGLLPFAALVAATILLQGCRHSIGRAARLAFLLVASSLAGIAAVIAIFAGSLDNSAVKAAVACSATASSYVGVAFYVHLLGGIVALFAAFEKRWNLTMPLFAFAIGGTAAAGFLFSPVIVTLVFGAAGLVLLAYVFVCSVKALATSGEFKLLVVLGIALTLGGLLAMALAPNAALERVASIKELTFLSDSFVSVRTALSGVALRSWMEHLWLGTGLGSFPLAFRFDAAPEDWMLVRAGAETVPNGWWFLLAERGVVGAAFVALPIGFLAFTYVRNLIGWTGLRTLLHPCCCLGPLVVIALAVTGLYGCALFRADVMILAMSVLAVSANGFPRVKRKENG